MVVPSNHTAHSKVSYDFDEEEVAGMRDIVVEMAVALVDVSYTWSDGSGDDLIDLRNV